MFLQPFLNDNITSYLKEVVENSSKCKNCKYRKEIYNSYGFYCEDSFKCIKTDFSFFKEKRYKY